MILQSNGAVKAYLLARVIQEPGGCWLWTRAIDRRGYGLCHVHGRNERAARAAYRAWVGPIPPGRDVHHLCPNRNCINPQHLEALPHGVHLRLHSASGSWAGSRNSRAKITEADVQYIKVARGLISAKDLSVKFRIGERNVYYIWNGSTWRHVDLPNFPARTQEEVMLDCQKNIQRALNALLSYREARRERGKPEPAGLEEGITLASMILAVGQ